MFTDYLETPLGWMEFKASDKGLRQLIFCGTDRGEVIANAITDSCKRQLAEYFAGTRRTFDLALDPVGTDFQKQVWGCLVQIPFGATASYGDIAAEVNRPKGSQAVGGANGRNPISIVVPCHRVIAASGSLTGYAGGIERKLWLLEHEGVELQGEQDRTGLDTVVHRRQSKTQYLN